MSSKRLFVAMSKGYHGDWKIVTNVRPHANREVLLERLKTYRAKRAIGLNGRKYAVQAFDAADEPFAVTFRSAPSGYLGEPDGE